MTQSSNFGRYSIEIHFIFLFLFHYLSSFSFPLCVKKLRERPLNMYEPNLFREISKGVSERLESICESILRIAGMNPKDHSQDWIEFLDRILRIEKAKRKSSTNFVAILRCVRRCANFLLLPSFHHQITSKKSDFEKDVSAEKFHCLYDVIEYGGRPPEMKYHTSWREWTAGVKEWKRIRQEIHKSEFDIHDAKPQVREYEEESSIQFTFSVVAVSDEREVSRSCSSAFGPLHLFLIEFFSSRSNMDQFAQLRPG